MSNNPDSARRRTFSNRRFLVILMGITLIALVARLGMTHTFVGLASPPDASASPDQLEYDTILQHLAAGHGYSKAPGQPTARRAPGLVFTLYPIYALTDGSYAAVRLQIILMSAATCLILGLIGGYLFNPRIGLIAAAILAVYPGHAYYAMHLLSEGPFAFYLALAILLTILAMQRPLLPLPLREAAGGRVSATIPQQSPRSAPLHRFFKNPYTLYTLAGLIWGLAVLTKPQFVLLGPLAGLVVLIYAFWKLQWRPIVAVAVCGIAGSTLVAPWIVRNAVVLDAPGLSTIGGYTLWAGNNPIGYDDPAWRGRGLPTSQIEAALGIKLPEGEAASDAAAKAHAKTFIADHRADMPQLTAWKLYRLITPFQPSENKPVYWSEAISWMLLAPFYIVGIYLALRRRSATSCDVRATLLMLGPVAITLAVTLVYMAIIRYRNALLPVIVPFAALAADTAARHLAARLAPTARRSTTYPIPQALAKPNRQAA